MRNDVRLARDPDDEEVVGKPQGLHRRSLGGQDTRPRAHNEPGGAANCGLYYLSAREGLVQRDKFRRPFSLDPPRKDLAMDRRGRRRLRSATRKNGLIQRTPAARVLSQPGSAV